MFCNPYILKVHGTSILTMFKAFGISFGAMFGITIIDANEPNYSRSKKVLLYTIFLSGTTVFCAYQAELTSALAVPSNKLPFRSPEDLLQTDYRYNYNTLKNIYTQHILNSLQEQKINFLDIEIVLQIESQRHFGIALE